MKRFLNIGGKRPPGYTHVVTATAGETIYISGQGGFAADGSLPTDFETQAHHTFRNIGKCLEAAGAQFGDLVKINYYLSDIQTLEVLRRVRAHYLDAENPPASTVVQSGLTEGLLLEVECIAVRFELP